MSTTYVLNEEGRRQVLEFIHKNGNTRIVEGIEDSVDARDSWFADVDCSENYLGYLEMPPFHTKIGRRLSFVFGPECFDEHNTKADALRDEVARWRQEAAEQGEIAHKLRVALEAVVNQDDWKNEDLHPDSPWGLAKAALAGEELHPASPCGIAHAALVGEVPITYRTTLRRDKRSLVED